MSQAVISVPSEGKIISIDTAASDPGLLDSGRTVLVDDATLAPTGLSISGADLYFISAISTGHAIYKVALAGGSPSLVLDLGESLPQQLAVAGTTIFWTDLMHDGVFRSDNGAAPTRVVNGGSGGIGLFGLATDGTSIYWSDERPMLLRGAALDGTGVTTLVDGNTLHRDRVGHGPILKTRAQARVEDKFPFFAGMAWQAGGTPTLFWASPEVGLIERAAAADGSGRIPLVVGRRLPRTVGIAVKGADVYWVERHTLMAVPAAGGSTRIVSALSDVDLFDVAVG